MKNLVNLFTSIALSILILGCSSTGEEFGAINTSDLAEADFVRGVLGQDPNAKGSFTVEPGSSVTTVHISTPSKPMNEASLRASLKAIKQQMKRTFDREPNTLRFVFEEVTIEE